MKLSIRTKLLGSAGLLLVFMAGIGLLSVVNLAAVDERAIKMETSVVNPIVDLAVARAKANENRAFLSNHILETDPAAKAELERKMTTNAEEIATSLAAVKESLVSDEAKQTMVDLEAALGAYEEARAHTIELSNAGKAAEAYAEVTGEALPAFEGVRDGMTKLFESKDALSASLSEEIASTYESSRTITIVLVVLAILVGLALSFWVARGISRGVKDVQVTLASLTDKCATWLQEGLSRFAQNDLTYEVTPVTAPIERFSSDEIGETARYANKMRDKLIATIGAYNEAR
ncbi:MAG: hypothetical protein C0498_11135, partial [Anaerolinea sp.]|nr:hypothetical protein [Anaerolinea sp.]